MIDLITFSAGLLKRPVVSAAAAAAAAAVELVFHMFAQQGLGPFPNCLIKPSQVLLFHNNTSPQHVQTTPSERRTILGVIPRAYFKMQF